VTSIAGMLLPLTLLMLLAWRGISVLILAPVTAPLAAMFGADTPRLTAKPRCPCLPWGVS